MCLSLWIKGSQALTLRSRAKQNHYLLEKRLRRLLSIIHISYLCKHTICQICFFYWQYVFDAVVGDDSSPVQKLSEHLFPFLRSMDSSVTSEQLMLLLIAFLSFSFIFQKSFQYVNAIEEEENNQKKRQSIKQGTKLISVGGNKSRHGHLVKHAHLWSPSLVSERKKLCPVAWKGPQLRSSTSLIFQWCFIKMS